MAFPLTGNTLTATNGVVLDLRPAASIASFTRAWEPPTTYARAASTRIYQIGTTPDATGAASTVIIGADGVVNHDGDAGLDIGVTSLADGVTVAYGDVDLLIAVATGADGVRYDRGGDSDLSIGVELVAEGIVAFNDDASVQVSVQIAAAGRIRLIQLPPARAEPQGAVSGWW